MSVSLAATNVRMENARSACAAAFPSPGQRPAGARPGPQRRRGNPGPMREPRVNARCPGGSRRDRHRAARGPLQIWRPEHHPNTPVRARPVISPAASSTCCSGPIFPAYGWVGLKLPEPAGSCRDSCPIFPAYGWVGLKQIRQRPEGRRRSADIPSLWLGWIETSG